MPRIREYDRGRRDIAQEVAALWNKNNGWIPAGDIKQLSDILGIDLKPAEVDPFCENPDCPVIGDHFIGTVVQRNGTHQTVCITPDPRKKNDQ